MSVRAWKTTAIVTLALAATGWGAWASLRPTPILEPALRLVDAGRPDDAERAIRPYLRAYPRDPVALFLHARITFERLERLDHRDPVLAADALAEIRRARTDDRRLAALGRFQEALLCEYLMRLDDAERLWREAFRLDPLQTDPAWRLLQVYVLQGRRQEARELALRLLQLGFSPREKRRALLELTRIDIHQPAAVEVIKKLTPIVEDHAGEFQSLLALGQALVREGRTEEGMRRIQDAVRLRPQDPDALDALLTALEDSGQFDLVERGLASLPETAHTLGIRARHQGRIEQERKHWKEATRQYRLAVQAMPDDLKLQYRLSRTLHLDGELAEAERLDNAIRDRDVGYRALRTFYELHVAELLDGPPDARLYQGIADLRERTGRFGEARAWHLLVLNAQPGNDISRAAVERLKGR